VSADWTGDDTKAINGVTFTIDRKANWVTFGASAGSDTNITLLCDVAPVLDR
jgi:hypothetical protein